MGKTYRENEVPFPTMNGRHLVEARLFALAATVGAVIGGLHNFVAYGPNNQASIEVFVLMGALDGVFIAVLSSVWFLWNDRPRRARWRRRRSFLAGVVLDGVVYALAVQVGRILGAAVVGTSDEKPSVSFQSSEEGFTAARSLLVRSAT